MTIDPLPSDSPQDAQIPDPQVSRLDTPMTPDSHEFLTGICLKAARDSKSKKVSRRLRAAMNAILSPKFKEVPEEAALMAAIAGTIKVIGDHAANELQAELYALGQISGKISGQDIKDEDIHMPKDSVGILILWEGCRIEHGLFRDVAEPIAESPEESDEWRNEGKNSENNS